MATFIGTGEGENIQPGSVDGTVTKIGGDAPGPGADLLDGGGGDDELDGGGGNDTIVGGTGSDTIYWHSGGGSDAIDGGDYGAYDFTRDALHFFGSGDAETFELSNLGATYHLTRDVEDVDLAFTAIESLRLATAGGSDRIVLNMLPDPDLRMAITIVLGSVPQGWIGDGEADTIIVNGSEAADRLGITTTGPGGVYLHGFEKIDTVEINAYGGDDTIGVGRFERDVPIDGGDGVDTVDYSNADAGVLVNLAAPDQNDGVAEGHQYTSIESVVGSPFADTLIGTSGANRLDGDFGDDMLMGGDGDDIYIVSKGDVVVEHGRLGGDDEVFAKANYALHPAARVEKLTALKLKQPIELTGSDYAQTITGGRRGDKLAGLDGNDTLVGGQGKDTLAGGDGRDVFVFDAAMTAANVDLIVDFSKRNDTIHLDDARFAGLPLGQLAKSAFHASTTEATASSTRPTPASCTSTPTAPAARPPSSSRRSNIIHISTTWTSSSSEAAPAA